MNTCEVHGLQEREGGRDQRRPCSFKEHSERKRGRGADLGAGRSLDVQSEVLLAICVDASYQHLEIQI